MLTFTQKEYEDWINTVILARQHWMKTMNMAMNDSISQINTFVASKKQKAEEDQKRISEALAKRAKESEVKNECENKSKCEDSNEKK